MNCKTCKQIQPLDAFPHYRNGECRTCFRDYMRAYRAQPHHVARIKAEQKHYAETGYYRRKQLFAKYGLTPEDVQQMHRQQDGRCAICAELFSASPHVDHDHESGQVRGLLCPNCNKGLGMYRDAPALLRQAAQYLESYSSSDG